MITGAQYETFECAKALAKKATRDPYLGSPFYKVRILSSRSKGAHFEKITKEYFKNTLDLFVTKPYSSDHDVIVEGLKVEVKGSTLWVDDLGEPTHFRWQQIRIHQDYDIMVFVAVYPDAIKFFYATKQDLIDNLDRYANNQHGGKSVDSGTMFIDGYPENFPWMKEITDASFVQR
jgi:hypothetical protein